MISFRISAPDDNRHMQDKSVIPISYNNEFSLSTFQIYEFSYFLNTASAITFLGALLPVHNSNCT